MNVLGPLSPARAGMLELLGKLRSSAPSAADVIAAKMQAAEDQKTSAVGVFDASREAEAEAFAVLEDLRRKRRHQIDATPRGRQPDQKILDDLADQIAAAEAELARKRARREDAGERAQRLRREFERLRDFLGTTSPAAIIAAVFPKVPKGATLESIRNDIAQTEVEAEKVRLAPLPRHEIVARVEREVDAIAARGAPSINARARNDAPANLASAVSIGTAGAGSLVGDAGARFFVWLMRDEIVARLSELVPDAHDALTDQERERRLAELAARKLQLERIEEALVEQAEAEGRKVQRRPDADVRAILGIEVREARP